MRPARLGAGLLLLAACATLQARETLRARAFAGADAEGRYQYVELSSVEGEALRATRVTATDGGFAREALPPAEAERLLAAVRGAGSAPGPALSEPQSPEFGAEVERLRFDPDAGPRPVALPPVGAFELRLYLGPGTRGGEVAVVSVGVPGTRFEAEAGHATLGAGGWAQEVLLLPGTRRGLLVAGSAARLGGALYRLDDLAALDLASAAASALGEQALEQLGQHQDHEAELTLSRALQLTPSEPTLLYNLACAQARQGSLESALISLRTALEADPSHLPRLARRDPDLDALHGLEAFRALVGEPRAESPGQ